MPFGPDDTRRQGGPAWLGDRRVAAAERAGARGLPVAAEEVWRYSRIAELDLDRWRPAEPVAARPGGAAAGADDVAAVGRVVVVDGAVERSWVDPALAAQGVRLGRLLDEPDARDLWGSVVTDAPDALVELNEAFASDPVVVRIPAGVVVEGTLVVEHRAGTGDVATFPRVVVDVGEDAEVTVLDLMTSDDVVALVVPVVELRVGRAARCRYQSVQQLGSRAWQLGLLSAEVEADATLLTALSAMGGDYARLRIDSRLVGRGATGDMAAVSFGDGDQMIDFRTLQDHIAPRTSSELLFKGAVEHQARSVYSGLIRVGKDGAGATAQQTNRNLILSEGAWAESVPNLEILNNDVRCSHASAVGPIDEDQRFYVESRGVPPEVAERLIVAGFFDDVVSRFPVREMAERLRRQVDDKLQRREAR